jgi:uncharacterized protein YkwD
MATPTAVTDRLSRYSTLEKLGSVVGVPFETAARGQTTVVTNEQFLALVKSGDSRANVFVEKVLSDWEAQCRVAAEKIKREREHPRPVPENRTELIAAGATPIAAPADAEQLKKAFQILSERGTRCGVSIEMASAPRTDITAPKLEQLIASANDDHRRAATLLLKKWGAAIKAKEDVMSENRGTTPKSAAPPQANKLSSTSTREIVGVTAQQREAILTSHNTFRSEYRKPGLTLDPVLCAKAQEWANNLARIRSMKHNDNRNAEGFSGNCGENLACGSFSGASAGAWVPNFDSYVAAWMSEKSGYDLAKKESMSGRITGHFTQVIWKSTTKLGVGFAAIQEGTSLYYAFVCNYHPAGNVIGQHAENI